MRGVVLREEPLARHTTLRVGGPAQFFLQPADVESLRAAVEWVRRLGLPYVCLGLGSNLLAPDDGFRGAVVSLSLACSWVRFDGPRVEVGAGYPLARLLSEAAERGMSGLEGLAGVPGTVGGALAMNAGTPGGDMARVTRRVQVLTPEGKVEEWPREALGFGYRTSRLQVAGFIALSAELELQPADRAAIRRDMNERAVRRRRTQPLDLPNAGSIWKNPPGDFAGRLIEVSGCKGWRVGDAQVSPKHANFIVNLGAATSAQVIRLMGLVRRRVRERHGVLLEPEIRWLRGQEELLELLAGVEGTMPDAGGGAGDAPRRAPRRTPQTASTSGDGAGAPAPPGPGAPHGADV